MLTTGRSEKGGGVHGGLDKLLVKATSSYRPDIDGLRAFAVLSVIVFHAFPAWLPGGFIGVDVFFVISGYLISGHIFDSLGKGSFSLTTFYNKRIKRIFPALVTVLAACLVFGWFALLVDEYLLLGLHVAGGAGFLSNLILWTESGYFDTAAATKPLLHLWSLGIEEQFYIFWPILAWLLWKLRVNLSVAIMLLAAASFALNTTYFQLDQAAAFYSPLTRFWELLAGTGLALYERNRPAPLRSSVALAISVVGALLLATSLALVHEGQNFPGWWALMPVAGAAFVIAAGSGAAVNGLLGLKPFVAIGLISYPLYLWHWPLLSFARIIEGDTPSRELRIALVLLTFVLATVTYFLIEKPLRFGRFGRAKTAALIVAMIAVGLSGYWIYKDNGIPTRPAVVSMAEASSQFGSSLWQYSSNETCLDRYPFEEANGYAYWFCVTSADAPPEIMLLGSSFANHLYPGIAFNPAIGGHTTLSIGACAPMMMPPTTLVPASTAPCEAAHWYKQQEYIKNLVTEAGTIKLAILDGIHLDQPANEGQIGRVKAWVDFLESRDIQVVIFVPHVWREGYIKGCFARPFKSPDMSCDIAASALEDIHRNFQPLMDSISGSNPDVVFYDQNELFCQNTCSFVLDGMPLIRDDTGHYTEFASRRLGDLFTTWAAQNAPQLLEWQPPVGSDKQ